MPATKNSSGLSVDWILSRKNVPKLNKVVEWSNEWTLETRGNEEINAGRSRDPFKDDTDEILRITELREI